MLEGAQTKAEYHLPEEAQDMWIACVEIRIIGSYKEGEGKWRKSTETVDH